MRRQLTGLIAGGIVAALAGLCVSFLVVRGRDLTRLIVTLGIGLMLWEAANKAAFITGGVDGLNGVVMWKLLGLFSFDLAGKTAYVYSLVVLFVLFVAARRLAELDGVRGVPNRNLCEKPDDGQRQSAFLEHVSDLDRAAISDR